MLILLIVLKQSSHSYKFCIYALLYLTDRFHVAIEISSSQSNRPRSIYQYSNMAPRLSGQNSIFGVVFFVSKSLGN